MARIPAVCVALLLAWIAGPACGDDLRPVYIEIESSAPGAVETRTRRPPRIPAYNQPFIELPAHCRMTSTRQSGLSAVSQHECSEPLGGQQLRIGWPAFSPPTPTILRYIGQDAVPTTVALGAGEVTWTVPTAGTTRPVSAQYTWLGIEHIWIGYDHLLFLVCLIWIAGTLPRIAWMVTGFTASHSLTLALATLGIVDVPVPWVEAVIALSVVFLAVEITKGRRDDSLTWRHPIAVSVTFGLLHGLGFAAVLGEIGLPEDAVVTGLLFFNIGVEVGQLAFVALLAVPLTLVRLSNGVRPFERTAQRASGYAVGCIASFWLVERIASFGG